MLINGARRMTRRGCRCRPLPGASSWVGAPRRVRVSGWRASFRSLVEDSEVSLVGFACRAAARRVRLAVFWSVLGASDLVLVLWVIACWCGLVSPSDGNLRTAADRRRAGRSQQGARSAIPASAPVQGPHIRRTIAAFGAVLPGCTGERRGVEERNTKAGAGVPCWRPAPLPICGRPHPGGAVRPLGPFFTKYLRSGRAAAGTAHLCTGGKVAIPAGREQEV
jgi:hypothetical protein